MTHYKVTRWPDNVRKEMNEKSANYSEPSIYGYGYYDGYIRRHEAIQRAIDNIQEARQDGNTGAFIDALLQNAIINLLDDATT